MEVRTKLRVLLVLGCKEINWKFYVKVIRSNRGWVENIYIYDIGGKTPLRMSGVTNEVKISK
jgi:hypothetical protein